MKKIFFNITRLFVFASILVLFHACQEKSGTDEDQDLLLLKTGPVTSDDLVTLWSEISKVAEHNKPQPQNFKIGSNDLQFFQNQFILIIQNGNEDGTEKVTNALIKIDGKVVVTPHDLSQKTDYLKIKIDPFTELSEMEVILRGQAGSKLGLSIKGTYKDQGIFTDERDNNKYRWVKIGKQIWMAENFRYSMGQVYPHIDNYKETHGLLYLASVVNSEILCPTGWHVPSDDEWKEMEIATGMTGDEVEQLGWRGTNQGEKLKAWSGWFDDGNGTDEYGFSALPGGTIGKFPDDYLGYGTNGFWWTSTITWNEYPEQYIYREMSSGSSQILRNEASVYFRKSIRLVKNHVNNQNVNR